MPLHAGARFHAFINGLFRPSEEAETWRRHARMARLLDDRGLKDAQGREGLANRLAVEVAAHFGMPAAHPQTERIGQLVLDIFDFEGMFLLPDIERDERYTIAQHFDLQAELNRQRALVGDFEGTCDCLKSTLVQCLNDLYSSAMPEGDDGIPFTADLVGSLTNADTLIEHMICAFLEEEGRKKAELFECLREVLTDNLILASGSRSGTTMRWPKQSTTSDPTALCETYLARTPFIRFLDQELTISLSQKARFEHTHVLGGTGHGKTQLLQYMIHYDLEKAVDDRLSVVVVDSQGDLIRKLSHLKLFSGPLSENLVIIDPTDIEHPPALNLFDAGMERLADYSPRQQELAFNSLVDIYGRFFGALLGAELTARQGSVFRYMARLMLTVPGATIHTLIELMDNVKPFQKYVGKLDPTAKRFFEQEFSKRGFNATRQQIKQRLYTVLSIPTFDRLFSAPKSKVNFFDALNNGSIILVNTAKDLLKADGAAIFGRFVLSLIEHAIMERATLKEGDRTPTFLYVDEAQDYFDETIETMLVQGRKFNFGLTLAHQNLAQLSPRLNAVLAGNTTIKLTGGITDKDAKQLARDMHTTPEMLLSMKKRQHHTEFALSVRNQTPHALRADIELGYLEARLTMPEADHEKLLKLNRERVCYKLEVPQPEPEPAPAPAPEPEVSAATTETAYSAPEQAPAAETADHRAIQEKVAAKAKRHGFAASVEYVLPNDKRIDVALFGHGLRIAVEVSVTNRQEYELSNIEKALEAGFDLVWMVAPDKAHRDQLKQYVREKLPPDRWANVMFASVGEVNAWMEKYTAPAHDPSRMAGYEVETAFASPDNASSHAHRLDQLRGVMSSVQMQG